MPPSRINGQKLKTLSPESNYDSWSGLPATALFKIYCNLSDVDRVSAAQVCRWWNNGFKHPGLWRSRKFVLDNHNNSGKNAVQFVKTFSSSLRHVQILVGDISFADVSSTLKPFTEYLKSASLNTLKVSFNKKCPVKNTAAMYIRRFIGKQHNLEAFDMSSATLELHPGLNLLQTLVQVSGPKMKRLFIEDFLQRGLDIVQTNQFREVLNKFTNLEEVAINYNYLSNKLFQHWAVSLSGSLKSLRVKYEDDERHHIIASGSWVGLKKAHPDLSVDLSLILMGNSQLPNYVLTPEIGVTNLYIWAQETAKVSKVLRHISDRYHHCLQSLNLECESLYENINNDLISLINNCLNLTSVSISAEIDIQVVKAISERMEVPNNTLASADLTVYALSVRRVTDRRTGAYSVQYRFRSSRVAELRREIQPYIGRPGLRIRIEEMPFGMNLRVSPGGQVQTTFNIFSS